MSRSSPGEFEYQFVPFLYPVLWLRERAAVLHRGAAHGQVPKAEADARLGDTAQEPAG
jgi:hypothetical protein